MSHQTDEKTRMHSSRMRTARLLTVSRSIRGGVCLGECLPGGVSQHAMGQTPPVNRMTDRQV